MYVPTQATAVEDIWIAPEARAHYKTISSAGKATQPKASAAADVWALGCLLGNILGKKI